MIIAVSDFVNRPYKLPNEPESPDFEDFIEAVEEEIAIKYLLGVELWEAFNDEVNSSGSGVPSDFFAKLRDGSTYTYSGILYKYNGWVDLIRPALYSNWQPEGTYKFTNVGWTRNKANSAPQGYNQSELIEDQYQFHVKHWNDFASKVGCNGRNCYNRKNTFYGFMKSEEGNFDDWVFSCPAFKNRYDF